VVLLLGVSYDELVSEFHISVLTPQVINDMNLQRAYYEEDEIKCLTGNLRQLRKALGQSRQRTWSLLRTTSMVGWKSRQGVKEHDRLTGQVDREFMTTELAVLTVSCLQLLTACRSEDNWWAGQKTVSISSLVMTGKRQNVAAMKCFPIAFSIFFFLRWWWRRPVRTTSNSKITFTIEFLPYLLSLNMKCFCF
jgi:hypothetical protein